ncbi:hypothetical protein FACS189431_2880 [Alphaproteobacteria bacterium]|nr:hypothetical protein FACS189431_2880 [Alphaproteobacteria bacterium]
MKHISVIFEKLGAKQVILPALAIAVIFAGGYFFGQLLPIDTQAAVSNSTAIPISKGGTSADNSADARDNFGLGSLATKSTIITSDITGGSVTMEKLGLTVESNQITVSGAIFTFVKVGYSVQVTVWGTTTGAIAAGTTFAIPSEFSPPVNAPPMLILTGNTTVVARFGVRQDSSVYIQNAITSGTALAGGGSYVAAP